MMNQKMFFGICLVGVCRGSTCPFFGALAGPRLLDFGFCVVRHFNDIKIITGE